MTEAITPGSEYTKKSLISGRGSCFAAVAEEVLFAEIFPAAEAFPSGRKAPRFFPARKNKPSEIASASSPKTVQPRCALTEKPK